MLLLLILLLILIGYMFYIWYPPLGGRTNPKMWLLSHNFHDRIFLNQISTSMSMNGRDIMSMVREQMRRHTMRKPTKPISPDPIDVESFLRSKTPQLIWLGHSSVLMRIDDKTILTDPILSMRSSPFPFIGPKRSISKLPITADKLPTIDAVFISHDHYDHLDYATIRKLRHKTSMFFIPLGVAAHLRKWGVPASHITELDWWGTTTFAGLQIRCTPARHFSGRALQDRFKTLWCSWVIEAPHTKIFFSGDTGYGPHFKQIGAKYGPFDLTLMECGQYDTLWADIHMTPEQTVLAHQDLKGDRLFPIHWGAFVLALHPWKDSVERAEKAAKTPHVRLISAKIGERIPMLARSYSTPPWWDL